MLKKYTVNNFKIFEADLSLEKNKNGEKCF